MDQAVTDGLELTQEVDTSAEKGSITNTRTESTTPTINTANVVTKSSCKKHNISSEKKKKGSKKSKKAVPDSSSESDPSSSSSSSESDEEDDDTTMTSTSSESDEVKKSSKRKNKVKLKSKSQKQKSKKKVVVETSEDESSSSSSASSESSDEDEDEEEVPVKKSKSKSSRSKSKKSSKRSSKDADSSDDDDDDDQDAALLRKISKLKLNKKEKQRLLSGKASKESSKKSKKKSKKSKKAAAASKVAFKRVDQLWDNEIHDYKLTETADRQEEDKFDQYIFTVRRKFDWEHKYQETSVDIRSKPLRDALSHVMGGVKSISLHVDVPKLDPNMLFLYLEEMRAYLKELKTASKSEKNKKAAKSASVKRAHLKILVKYLDHDFADVKKTLYPMLEKGTISSEYLWALYKPNTIAYTTTYGDTEEPRAFKIDYATKETSFTKGTFYFVEGKYLDFNGKEFGMATMDCDVDTFKGVRQISSLACYPLKYHKEPDKVREQLRERGKKFVTLKGMNYKHHNGRAYMKKKRQVYRFQINSRVMVDSALFRRINPNYNTGTISQKDEEEEYFSGSDEGSCCCCSDNGSDGGGSGSQDELDQESTRKHRYRLITDKDGEIRVVEIEYDDQGNEVKLEEKLEETSNPQEEGKLDFTDEELILASPVVLGFAFQDKSWLELSVSGIGEVQWNNGAFESLVLPANQKRIVKALVSSHKFHPSKNLDDIIAKKGLGCIMVLHGPPGTGKTLTAEGIAELLRAPLYMVSAGELGTDPRTLERELQNILDIAHSWGAILLLDEADVFMEKRSLHDIHRNALVGIFLRLLEYFQGILFLTTNRVETFDDAFQSRIHVALRFRELDFHAKKSVWKMFISRIQAVMPTEKIGRFTDSDLDRLARRNLNGRQIKNAVRAAQALAVDQETALGMGHVEEVLQVAQSFEQDLRGGTGYEEAMRSYF